MTSKNILEIIEEKIPLQRKIKVISSDNLEDLSGKVLEEISKPLSGHFRISKKSKKGRLLQSISKQNKVLHTTKQKQKRKNAKLVHSTKMSKQFSTLQALLDSILQMKRSDANKFLSGSCKNYFPQHLIKRYEEIKEKELFHIKHVRKCMEKLKADGTPNRHDHTKDAFYIFITSCHFNLNDECTVPPEILKSVIAQHHKAERHHPEYEKYNPKKELGNDDIMEMAVDRLSRNLQANQGEFNNQNIEQYMPSFPKNHKKKIEIYKEYVKALQPMVKATFQELQSTN